MRLPGGGARSRPAPLEMREHARRPGEGLGVRQARPKCRRFESDALPFTRR
jgi:hypothetical protein